MFSALEKIYIFFEFKIKIIEQNVLTIAKNCYNFVLSYTNGLVVLMSI